MEIRRYVRFTSKDRVESIIESLGIKYVKWPRGDDGSFSAKFYIAESDPRWDAVDELVEEKRLYCTWYTEFTKEDFMQAEWLRFMADRNQGYPQPERGMEWENLTFSQDQGCRDCGVGKPQVNSLRIKKEPSLSNHGLGLYGFMHLFWASGTFATPKVFEVFAKELLRGYEKWPAIIHSTGKPAENIAQIYVPGETRPGLIDNDNLVREKCELCSEVKFNVIRKGRMKYYRDALPTNLDFVRTHEWFGSGGFAKQEMLITNRVARLMLDRGWKGVVLAPLELV